MADVASSESPKKRSSTRTKSAAAKKTTAKKTTTRAVAKKATAKKTTRKATTKKTTAKKTTQKKADTTPARAVEAPAAEAAQPAEVMRRAPTEFAAHQSAKKKRQVRMIVVAVLLLAGIGASAVVGYRDGGYIDINETILSKYSPEDRASGKIPVQNTNAERKVDGGLKGLGTGGGNQAATPVATSTASTTDATATSTASSTANTASSTEAVVIDDEEAARPEDAPQDTATTTEPTL